MSPLIQRQYSFYTNDEIIIDDSETDNDSDSDSDSDYSLTPSDIMNNENDDIQENGKKLIGSYYLIKNTKYGIPTDYKWLLYLSVSCKNFFEFKYSDIHRYLKGVCEKSKIGLLEVNYIFIEEDDIFYSSIIDKTIWLRLIQRKWKKIVKKRKEIIKNRLRMESIHERQITGKWPIELRNLPSIVGCLADIKQ